MVTATEEAPRAKSSSILELPCRVLVPDELRERLFRSGMSPSMTHVENRRYPRLYCGGEKSRIGIRFLNSIASLHRSRDWRGAILLDISRGGVQLLSDEEIYPAERLRLALSTEPEIRVLDGEAAWCRRLGPRCYSVGVRFLPSS